MAKKLNAAHTAIERKMLNIKGKVITKTQRSKKEWNSGPDGNHKTNGRFGHIARMNNKWARLYENHKEKKSAVGQKSDGVMKSLSILEKKNLVGSCKRLSGMVWNRGGFRTAVEITWLTMMMTKPMCCCIRRSTWTEITYHVVVVCQLMPCSLHCCHSVTVIVRFTKPMNHRLSVIHRHVCSCKISKCNHQTNCMKSTRRD